MSTKIYHGYRLDPLSLEALHAWLQAFQTSIQGVRRGLQRKRLAQLVTAAIDWCALAPSLDAVDGYLSGLFPAHQIPDDRLTWSLLALMQQVMVRRQRAVRETLQRAPEDDFDCSVTVIPHNGQLYALFFAEQPAYHRLWRRQRVVHPFPYWDNHDRMPSVSRKAWKARGALWKAILGSDPPAQRGLTMTLTPLLAGLDSSRFLFRSAPRRGVRVAHWAKERCCTAYVRAHAPDSPDNLWPLVFQWSDWVRTPEGHAALQAETAAVEAILPYTLRAEWLQTTPRALFAQFHSIPSLDPAYPTRKEEDS